MYPMQSIRTSINTGNKYLQDRLRATNYRWTRCSWNSLASYMRPYNVRTSQDKKSILEISPKYKLHSDELHCFIGSNGSGKTKFLKKLLAQSSHSYFVDHLSLDRHRSFVKKHGVSIVAHLLGGIGSPSARDLIIRLGLYPVWESQVKHLSTGEIRKLMLATTLLQVPRPSLLLLDQPFDGLDVYARKQLEWMLGQVARGFTRLLVETGTKHEAFAYKTQILLVANRMDQIVPNLLTHVVLFRKPNFEDDENMPNVSIEPWLDKSDSNSEKMWKTINSAIDHDSKPVIDDATLKSLINELFSDSERDSKIKMQRDDQSDVPPALKFVNLSIAYKNRNLLEEINFVKQRQDHWALLGPNGSGKSSLMRVLMQKSDHGKVNGSVYIYGTLIDDMDQKDKFQITAVSTDHHIEILEKCELNTPLITVMDIIQDTAVTREKAEIAARLLGLYFISPSFVNRAFLEVSQGEQKLVLIARALATCPDILILDEITHGLDPHNRRLVLSVINAVGKYSPSTHMIFITHHQEEIMSCFTSVYEMRERNLMERTKFSTT